MSLDVETIEAIQNSVREYCKRISECAKRGHPGGGRVFGVGSFSNLYFCSDCGGHYEWPITQEDYAWLEKMLRTQITI